MFWIACRVFIVMSLLTGCIYPLLMTGIASLTMPWRAGGSLIVVNGEPRGSELIAQKFSQDKYFWPRPSVNHYDALQSGGSNLGPTSLDLKKIVMERAQKLAQAHQSSLSAVPAELIYASGSGLDPHISPEAAYFQSARVARARSIHPSDEWRLRDLIDQLIEEEQGKFFTSRYVNVLKLNQRLDDQFSQTKSDHARESTGSR